MRVVGFKLKKVLAELIKEPEGLLSVNSKFNLGEVKKQPMPGKDNYPIFSFEFVYSIIYEDIANLEFKGLIYIEIEKEEIVLDLEENKPFQDKELRKFIIDAILRKTYVESLRLEEKLNLPFHLQSPKVNISSQENSQDSLLNEENEENEKIEKE